MRPSLDQPEFDFEHSLPAGKEYFSLRYLARLWSCSEDNVQRLIDEGELQIAPDLAPMASKHALPRVHRWSVVALLERRNDHAFMSAHRAKKRTQIK